jgi:hypothetical protein
MKVGTRTDIPIISDGLTLQGTIIAPPSTDAGCGVLFMHGGGTANRTRYADWQSRLCSIGVSSLAFDFRGCGDSEGRFTEGSLLHRIDDACAAYDAFIRYLGTKNPQVVLAGSSMGGHIAARVTGLRPSAALILQSAAAYPEEAESLPLNGEFTEAIRKPGAYTASPALSTLSGYTHPILCIYGANDDIIPFPVMDRYMQIARRNGLTYTINGYGHTMLSPKTGSDRRKTNELYRVSTRFIKDRILGRSPTSG